MEIKFNKDAADSPQATGDNKGKQNILLVVLLVLVGGFAYIYFFTGLIKPMSEQKVAESPAPPQVTRKPLPAPDGAPLKADNGGAKKEVVAPAAKPAPAPSAPAAAPAQVSAAKPVGKEAAKPKEELEVGGGTSTAVKKQLPAGNAGAAKTASLEKKQPAVAENKTAELKRPVAKQGAGVTAAVKVKKEVKKPVKNAVAVPGKVTGSGPWTVLVGNYVLEDALATDLARVRKAGLEAYVVPGARKKSQMNRLLLAEFTDRDSAQTELAKLKRLTSDAFMVDSAGIHVVYAGSYLLEALAVSEKERLDAAGFKVTVKRVEVSIPTKNLTAGSFAEKSAAEDVLKKLQASDVKAALSRQ